MNSRHASQLTAALKQAVPAMRTSELPSDRISYSRDLWPRHHLAVRAGKVAPQRPAAIAWPTTTDDASKLVAWCAQRGVAMVPFGAGSGVCGGIRPEQDSLVVDLKQMRRWRHFDEERGTLDVEAGALGIRLEEELQARGYTVGHFPSSILCSTVGGWVAGRGAGQCSGRYGKIEDMVASIELVSGAGDQSEHHRRTQGPSLVPLLVGSEGTLGLITSTKLRLHKLAECRHFNAMTFPSMQAGHGFIQRIYQAGLRPAVCRLYDPFDSFMARRGKKGLQAPAGEDSALFEQVAPFIATFREQTMKRAGHAALRGLLRAPAKVNALVDALGNRFLGGCKLVLIFEGEEAICNDQAKEAEKLAQQAGAQALGPGPALHWLEHRYAVSYRQAPMFIAGTFVDTMEVAAPWSRLQRLYDEVRKALAPHVFVMAHISHAYPDGCSIYFTFAACARDESHSESLYDEAWKNAMQAAIAAGGTLAHHHGVGRSKAPMMRSELGEGVDVVRKLRHALDPAGIFNPGNLIPDEHEDPPSTKAPPASRNERDLPHVDTANGLIQAAGHHSVAACQNAAQKAGLLLAADGHKHSRVADWIAAGAPGASDPWLDPVSQHVAGYRATLHNGSRLDIHPCPRRSVGPDLFALFFGMQERIGTIDEVHLQARRVAAPALHTSLERNPELSPGETTRIDEICLALAAKTPA